MTMIVDMAILQFVKFYFLMISWYKFHDIMNMN